MERLSLLLQTSKGRLPQTLPLPTWKPIHFCQTWGPLPDLKEESEVMGRLALGIGLAATQRLEELKASILLGI